VVVGSTTSEGGKQKKKDCKKSSGDQHWKTGGEKGRICRNFLMSNKKGHARSRSEEGAKNREKGRRVVGATDFTGLGRLRCLRKKHYCGA